MEIDKVLLRDLISMTYTVNLDLPADPGESVTGSMVINRRDFIVERIKHCVLADDGTDPEQYQLDWSIQNDRRFWKGDQAPMAALFGSVKTGRWQEISPPIPLEQQTTVYIKLTNRYPAGGLVRKVQVVFEGSELREGEP